MFKISIFSLLLEVYDLVVMQIYISTMLNSGIPNLRTIAIDPSHAMWYCGSKPYKTNSTPCYGTSTFDMDIKYFL